MVGELAFPKTDPDLPFDDRISDVRCSPSHLDDLSRKGKGGVSSSHWNGYVSRLKLENIALVDWGGLGEGEGEEDIFSRRE